MKARVIRVDCMKDGLGRDAWWLKVAQETDVYLGQKKPACEVGDVVWVGETREFHVLAAQKAEGE